MTISPQLRALGSEIRLLAVFIDAVSAFGWYCREVQAQVDTALIVEGDRESGWNDDHYGWTNRMRNLGVVNQEGIYLLAGLTKRQREVAFMHYDRQLEPVEIAKYLRIDAHTVRVHLQAVDERLRKLAA